MTKNSIEWIINIKYTTYEKSCGEIMFSVLSVFHSGHRGVPMWTITGNIGPTPPRPLSPPFTFNRRAPPTLGLAPSLPTWEPYHTHPFAHIESSVWRGPEMSSCYKDPFTLEESESDVAFKRVLWKFNVLFTSMSSRQSSKKCITFALTSVQCKCTFNLLKVTGRRFSCST